MGYLYRAFLQTLLVLAIVLPFGLIAIWRVPSANRKLIIMVAVLLFVESAFLRAPRMLFFAGLYWNWQGKILEILWPFLFILVYHRFSFSEIGMTLKLNSGSLRPIVLMALLSLLPTVIGIAFGNRLPANIETLLFQMTMPGIGEELVFRGVLLSLLNQAFGKTKTLWNAQVGWGLILTALLFSAVHFVTISKTGAVHFHIANMLSTLGIGLALGWIRERGGSLLPCVVLHNLGNTLIVAGSYLLG
jgi:membrane protease YdiL (CAAX protease family)